MIDEALKEAARSGLKSLTLCRLPDGTWQANASPDGVSWRVVMGADPVAAVADALGAETKKTEEGVFG